ncbi:MAG TPA: ABC transporter ATP-binding protein [Candidatus Krumholzibacteria bacterium]|nr:ABC transporter ATP-binding protein [Candidatus Krumholzibacteria bacterium]
MPELRLEAIEKIFPGGHTAVAGVDLEVRDGELVVLLGPSGCGKSTLLRIVAGIESPTQGRVLLGGRDVTELPPQQRDIAMVFQNYALYPHMSVRDNLGFGLKMRGESRQAVARRATEVAESLGITTLLDRKPSQLSGGQRQRVALGRAIARNAKTFLLDEPLSNLDVQLRVQTRTEIARLHRELHVPMLYVTHDQEEAMTLGDRVAVMHSGRFLQVGTPLEIYNRPATQFVARFVGSPRMNLLPGSITRTPDGKTSRLEMTGAVIDLPPFPALPQDGKAPASRATDSRPVVVGIRPEDVSIPDGSGADARGRVDVVEPLGRETLLHVVLEQPSAEPVRVLVPGQVGLALGAQVGLHFQRHRLHFFDPETQRQIAWGVPSA